MYINTIMKTVQMVARMFVHQIFFFFFMIFLGGYVFVITSHKRRLKQMLDMKDVKEFKKMDMKQPLLASANLFLVLAAVLLTFAITTPQIPFTIAITSPIWPYNYVLKLTYQTWVDLTEDILLPAIITITFSCVYPLRKNLLEIADWFEFWIGFVFGGALGSTLAHSGPSPLILVFLPFILGPIFYVIYSMQESPAGFIGIVFGFFFLLLFVLVFDRYSILFWTFIMLALGIAVSSSYTLESRLYPIGLFLVLFIPLLIPSSSSTALLSLLLGLTISVIYRFIIKPVHKAILIALSMFSFLAITLYFMNEFAWNLIFIPIFVVFIASGVFLTLELYKISVKTMLSRLMFLSLKLSEDGKIDLIKQETIGKIKKGRQINKDSPSFVLLNNLVLKALEKQGLQVRVIDEKTNGKKYIKAIIIERKAL